MDAVTCYCSKCKSELGRFRNSWNGIGNTYHSPIYPAISIRGLEETGDVYEGARGSAIENSHLQDVACRTCQAVLGLRCELAGDGDLLKPNQLILRLKDMSIVSESSGQKARISVMESFALTKSISSRRASTAQLATRTNPKAFQRASSQLATGGTSQISEKKSMMPPPPRAAVDVVSEAARFKAWAQEAISDQQKTIDRISGSLDRMDRQMKEFTAFMEHTRKELASINDVPRFSGEDLANVREELDELRQQISRNGGQVSRGSVEISNRELEEVSGQVRQIGARLSEVDIVKSELARMKARIEELTTPQTDRQPEISLSHQQQSRDKIVSTRSKRKYDELASSTHLSDEDAYDQDPAFKRNKLQHDHVIHNQQNSTTRPSEPEIPESSRSQNLTPEQEIIDLMSSDEEIASPSLPLLPRNGPKPLPESVAKPTARLTRSSLNALSSPVGKATSIAPKGLDLMKNNAGMEISRRRSDIGVPSKKTRDAYGHLLLAGGRIDKRSLGKAGRADSIVAASSIGQSPVAKGGPTRSRISLPVLSTTGRNETVPPNQLHPKSGNTEKLFRCGGCGRPYRTAQGLDWHHMHKDCKDATKDELPSFDCLSCGKKYKVRESLKYHLKYSITCGQNLPDKNAVECDSCGKTWKDQQHFDAHKCFRNTISGMKSAGAGQATKEQRLIARDRMVRETLEREIRV